MSKLVKRNLFYWSSHKADKNPIPSTTYNYVLRVGTHKNPAGKKFTTCPCSAAPLERTSLLHATIVQYCAAKIVQQNSEFHIMDWMCHDSVVVDIPHSIHDKTETVDGQIPNSAVECSIVENDGVVRGRIPYSSDADNEIRCDMQCMSILTRKRCSTFIFVTASDCRHTPIITTLKLPVEYHRKWST